MVLGEARRHWRTLPLRHPIASARLARSRMPQLRVGPVAGWSRAPRARLGLLPAHPPPGAGPCEPDPAPSSRRRPAALRWAARPRPTR